MKKEERKTPVHSLKRYSYYSGMAIQMGVIIGGGTYGGVKLDAYLTTTPLFTLVFSLTAIALSLYLIIKELPLLKNKKNAKDTD